MSDYYEVAALIQPHVIDAPLPMVIDAIRRAAIKYCEESDAYRLELQPVPAIANVAYYDLPLPFDTMLARIVAATYQGKTLQPTSTVLRLPTPDNNGPLVYQQVGNRVRIHGKPESTILDAFIFEVSLRPTATSTYIDDNFLAEHGNGIVNGALSRLLSQPGQSWSNPQLAGYYEGMYQEDIRLAQRRANNDNTAKDRECSYGGL